MDREPKPRAAADAAATDGEDQPPVPREVVSLSDCFRQTTLTGLDSLDVTQEPAEPPETSASHSYAIALVLGITGSLIAAAIYEFLGPALHRLMG